MRNNISKAVASVAGAALIAVIIALNVTPVQVRAAQKLIDQSLAATGGVRSMVMQIDVRTRPMENFAAIDPGAAMVSHTLTVLMDNPSKWRLEKQGRTAMFDGTTKYMWGEGPLGFKGGPDAAFEEWFGILLDPRMVLLQEKASTEEKGVKYKVETIGDQIIMTADVKAKGDFTNSYTRNSSIEESDTRREIVFDRATKLIKSLKVYVKLDRRQVPVVDVKSVRYDAPVDVAHITVIPAGYRWRDVGVVVESSGKFAGITAEQAARLIADAINCGDLAQVGEAFVNYDLAALTRRFAGVKVSTGKPFKSGMYPGVFVPYQVALADGTTEKWNIALRNDTPNGQWIVDGGI